MGPGARCPIRCIEAIHGIPNFDTKAVLIRPNEMTWLLPTIRPAGIGDHQGPFQQKEKPHISSVCALTDPVFLTQLPGPEDLAPSSVAHSSIHFVSTNATSIRIL